MIKSRLFLGVLPFVGACEVLLVPLPTPCEELPECSGSSTGDPMGSSMTAPATGGAAGGGGDPSGTGGATSSGTGGATSSTGGSASTTTETTTCKKECDCDEDDYVAKGCGGPDCDDNNSDVNPDAGFHDDEIPVGKGYDWNCDDQTEWEIKADLCGNPLICPTDKEVYIALVQPPCGTAGPRGLCIAGLLSCTPGPTNDSVAKCR